MGINKKNNCCIVSLRLIFISSIFLILNRAFFIISEHFDIDKVKILMSVSQKSGFILLIMGTLIFIFFVNLATVKKKFLHVILCIVSLPLIGLLLDIKMYSLSFFGFSESSLFFLVSSIAFCAVFLQNKKLYMAHIMILFFFLFFATVNMGKLGLLGYYSHSLLLFLLLAVITLKVQED